ncbi:hypothetical protein P7L78_05180 [Tistrella bauzanensis]|uniref:hypothetical protein n=1 Tax=Tistrella TaxID=171436 RepID=UPI0031F5F564
MTAPPRPLAIVTGASGGIGREIALGLATRGHDLLMTAGQVARIGLEATSPAGRWWCRDGPTGWARSCRGWRHRNWRPGW